MQAVTLYSTWPDQETARAAGRALIEQGLAACVNIVPGALSIFRWEGAVEEQAEALLLAKTSAARAEAACAAMLALHPYATPCVTALRIDPAGSNAAFLAWITAETA